MEDTLYWIIEYCKVLSGYGFLMFVWPMVVFRKYLKGKSVTFRFSFCVTGQVVLISTVVLLLGLLHILNDWTLRILFYGTFFYSVRELYWLTPERKQRFKYLVNGTFGFKNFLFLQRRKLIRIIEEFCKKIGRFYKKHWLEYSMLLVTLIYGLIYFSWGTLQERTYGFSDIVVHHNWTYGLASGTPFSAGIYPEGMHCVIYAMHALFGIKLYSCMLFISLANVIVTLVALYCFMKEIFRSRYSAILVLSIVLTFGEIGIFIVWCMSRMQCALPQEFALPAIFTCALYLLRYLKGERRIKIKGKETKGCWNEDLLVFTLALISTIAVHFYATFMAFFICVGIAVFLWKRIFTKGHFIPLVTSVILSVVVAGVPMVAGYATGIPLQGSLYWAMGVMQESSEEEFEEEWQENTGEVSAGKPEYVPGVENTENNVEPVPERSFMEKVFAIGERVWNKLQEMGRIIFDKAFLMLYSEAMSWRLLAIMFGVLFCSFLVFFVRWCKKKKRKEKEQKPVYIEYCTMVGALAVYIVIYSAYALGLPELVERNRTCFVLHIIACIVLIIPIDYIISLVRRFLSETLIGFVSCGVIAGSIALIYVTGNYHGYLYFELTRYDAVAQVTNQIIEELPQNNFTIVSTTEDLYQVIEYGRHEEMLKFVKSIEEDDYVLPTEYVFLMVEKRPFDYLQNHFFDGPAWLAGHKFSATHENYSRWPEYLASDVSEEAAAMKLEYYSNMSDYYMNLIPRTIIESKAYEWCQKFEEIYPNEFKVYYEDEYLVCFYFRQNTEKMYNLSLE